MKRKVLLGLVLFVIGMCLAVSSVPAGGKATKTEVIGLIQPPIIWHQFGETWTNGPIHHVRGRLVEWDIVASDDRFSGALFDEFNSNQDTRTFYNDGRIWGKLWIEQDGVRVWEGSWNGEVLDSIQQGRAILHGVGIYKGLKAKMNFIQRPGEYIIDFDAIILNPKGD